MGVVWRVFDPEWDRDLALKLPLSVVLESPVLRERYVREAETWIGLGVHPHIVQCWFVTEIDGVPALFLDYLTGGSLADWMEEGHVRPGQWQLIVEIVMQVAEGLAYAHSKGVIHRDVKPENLLIRGDERVCVTDFGLVKTAVAETEMLPEGLLESGNGVTCVGAFLGTPRYAAPEQWGAAERVGPPADVYALGVILYELCCGRRPFDDDEESVPPMDLVRRNLVQPPPDPRDFNPNVPPELTRLCLRMLEKNPAQRPSDMMSVRESLRAVHHRLTGRMFRSAAPLRGAQTADVLNNQGVSLNSLGKTTEALEALRRGLDLDPGHPECLYNLVQLERRSGRLGHQEALRRLKQARASYPLALLLIEQGRPSEALQALTDVQPQELCTPGLHHRARADALMHLGQFSQAERAYSEAQSHMPKDVLTAHRRGLAAAGTGHDLSGAIHFPSSRPILKRSTVDPTIRLGLDHRGEGVVGVTQAHAIYQSLEPDVAETKVPRGLGAGRVSNIWAWDDRLAIADSRGFELRRLPSMQLVCRQDARLLACTPQVSYLIVVRQATPSLYVVESGEFQDIATDGHKPGQGPFLAAFDSSGQALSFLLPSGRLAVLDEDNRAVATPWPALVEGHQEARCLAVTSDQVTIVGLANGTIRSYDINHQALEFSIRLPDSPASLEVRASDARIIVRTTRGGFFILSRLGQVLLAGEGPLAADPQGSRALVLWQGRQVLLNLNPLYELRCWSHEVSHPESAAFSGDGRLAVTLGLPGTYEVWEVDEPNRVYQRDLLMSPGRSYADILSAEEQFHRHLSLASEALARREYPESHRHLQRARKVPGYGHSGAALDFGWRLLEPLKRDQLEAVWERLSIEDVFAGDIDLEPEGRELLFCAANTAHLARERAGSVDAVWTISRPELLCLTRFVQPGEGGEIVTVTETGQAALHDRGDGHVFRQFSLGEGSLVQVMLHGSTLTFLDKSGGLGQFDLADGYHVHRQVGEFNPQLFAPWQRGKVLLTTHDSFGILDLAQPGTALQPLRLGLEITKVPCFVKHLPERGLLVLGFHSGTLRVLDLNGAGVLAALSHGQNNIVTSFELLSDLSVALTTTASGQIYFWDLRTEELLDEFLVHRNGVSRLRASRNGRYLLTSGNGGIIRFWETSWTAGEVRGSDREAYSLLRL
jgi:serine/threonine protein kinase